MLIIYFMIFILIEIQCEKAFIYEGDSSIVYDLITDYDHFRYISTKNDSGWQGIISVKNPGYHYKKFYLNN